MEEYNRILEQKEIRFWSKFRRGCAVVCAQEFSRKIVSWNLIHLGKFDLDIHLYPGEYLAGGAVLTKIREAYTRGKIVLVNGTRVKKNKWVHDREINDYDIFFTRYPEERLREIVHAPRIETPRYISYTDKKNRKIQLIKRIYASPDQIIGGFDVDPCRFIQDADGNVFTTHGGLYSLFTGDQIINPFSQSKNFYYRILKYYYFRPIHIYAEKGRMMARPFANKSDYESTQELYFDSIAADNVLKIITDSFDHLIVANGQILPLEKLLQAFEAEEEYFVGFQQLRCMPNPGAFGRIRIRAFYQKYVETVGQFIYTNPHRQFTGSFFPTNFPMNVLYQYPRKIDLIRIFPEILTVYVRLRGARIPKPLIHRVLRDYFDHLAVEKYMDTFV